MGQDLAKECGCGYGAEEDAVEQRVEIDQSALRPGTTGKAKAANRLPEHEEEQYSAPPPPPAPAAGTAVAKPKPKPARDLRSPKLSLDKILQDLEGSEDASYSAAFSTMAGDQAQLTPDNPALRTFLEQYSGVTDVDTELLKIASNNEAFAIDCSNFVMLLRLNPLNEAEALESFLRLSGGGDQITAEDCRTGLFQVIQSIGSSLSHSSFNAHTSERIIDAAMVSAGLQVSMEQWIGLSKTAARICRLALHAKAI